MQRLKAIIEYDGTNYHGWQIQPNGISIQEVLTQAWSKVNGSEVVIHAAGRTDAGVHALGQVMHCDVSKELSEQRWQAAINNHLPVDIRVRSVEFCDVTFHARFSAREKTYSYKFWKGNVVSPFWQRYVYAVPNWLNWELMNLASHDFQGTHDFTQFTVTRCDSTATVQTITKVLWQDLSNSIYSIEITGTGFLRYMVRRIVGLLLTIGMEKLPPTAVIDALLNQKQIRIFTAPAKGLTLLRVYY